MSTTGVRERLQKRAQDLARPLQQEQVGRLSLVTFTRAGHRFGARLGDVRGAMQLKELTQVPGAPAWMFGAVQYQGAVLSLLDLAQMWGLPTKGVADQPVCVVITHAGRSIGLLTESLHGVQEAQDFRPYQGPSMNGVDEIAQVGKTMLFVLSAESIFSDPRLA